MAKPTDRKSFTKYCLTKLGAPVLRINVSEEQVQDRIDEALNFWWTYAVDGSEKIFFKYEITDEDKANQYITLPENIHGAIRIFDMGLLTSSIANPFDIQYQFALNELWQMAGADMVPYYTTRTHMEFIQQMLVGQKPIRYNQHTNRLYIDMNWKAYQGGKFILVEAYEVIDPEIYSDAYSDRLLQNYACALIKRQWASNLSKFDGLALTGDNKFDASRLTREAEGDIEKFEKMIMDQNIPNGLWMG